MGAGDIYARTVRRKYSRNQVKIKSRSRERSRRLQPWHLVSGAIVLAVAFVQPVRAFANSVYGALLHTVYTVADALHDDDPVPLRHRNPSPIYESEPEIVLLSSRRPVDDTPVRTPMPVKPTDIPDMDTDLLVVSDDDFGLEGPAFTLR